MKRTNFTVLLAFLLLLATLLCSCNDTTFTSAPSGDSPSESDDVCIYGPDPDSKRTIFPDSTYTEYRLHEVDGKWYMNFPKSETFGGRDEKQIEFSSIDDIKETVLKGSFSSTDLYKLYTYHIQTEHGISVFDPNTLNLPAISKKYIVDRCVWNGEESYTISFYIPNYSGTINNKAWGNFTILTEEAFNDAVAQSLQTCGLPEEELISVSTYVDGLDTRFEDAPIFVYDYKDENGKVIQREAKLVSKIITEEKILYIEEMIRLSDDMTKYPQYTFVGEPCRMTIYGNDGGVYFKTELTLHKEGLFSEKDLLSFGVKLLEE